MTYKYRWIIFACVFSGCGKFTDNLVGAFQAQLISPAPDRPRDLVTGNGNGNKECVSQASRGNSSVEYCPVANCSISDPVIGVQVHSSGCKNWQLSISPKPAGSRSPLAEWTSVRTGSTTSVATANLADATIRHTRNEFLNMMNPDCERNVEAVATCGDLQIATPLSLFFSGFTTELSDSEKIALGPTGRLISVSRDAIVGAGEVVEQLGDVADNIYVRDGDVVVSKYCQEAWCQAVDPNAKVIVSFPADGTKPIVKAMLAKVIGNLRPHRIAFWEYDGGTTPAARVLLTDADLGHPRRIVLSGSLSNETTFVSQAVSANGSFVFIVFSEMDQHFYKATLNPSSEVMQTADLGVGPTRNSMGGIGVNIAVAPDASYFVYQSINNPCTFAARGTSESTDRWTKTFSCTAVPPMPVFLGDAVVFADSAANAATALDPLTLHPLWSTKMGGNNIPVILEVSGDALLITTISPHGRGLTIIGADGTLRFVQHHLPFEIVPNGFVTDGMGILYTLSRNFASQDDPNTRVVQIGMADARFHAPPTQCSRVDCGRGVIDLAVDAQNCGQCGNTCPASSVCQFGDCRSGE